MKIAGFIILAAIAASMVGCRSVIGGMWLENYRRQGGYYDNPKR